MKMISHTKRQPYPTDLSDAEWDQIVDLIPEPSTEGREATIERRELVNGMFYMVQSGCSWRMLPHDLPCWSTLGHYFRLWKREGVWQRVLDRLRQRVREQAGREREPSVAVLDSQSVKTSAVRGPEKGYDAGKKNLGPQTTDAR